MSESDQRSCVLCGGIIGKDEDRVIIRVQQPAHRRCYVEALAEPQNEENGKKSK